VGKKKRRSAFENWETSIRRQPSFDTEAAAWSAEPGTVDRFDAAAVESNADPARVLPEAIETLPHDVHLLERARALWQFGEWRALAALDADALTHHPDRAKLALLAATGHCQCGQTTEARLLARKAIEWGADSDLVKRMLLSGVHNSLARAAALAGMEERVRRHFEDALKVGLPGGTGPMAVRARAENELTQVGLGQRLPHLVPAAPEPDAPSYVKRRTTAPANAFQVLLPERQQRQIALYPDHQTYVEQDDDDRILFEVPVGMSLVLSSNTDGQLSQVPLQDQFRLMPSTGYRVTGHLACTGRGATLCLIEYDGRTRITDHTQRATDNRFDMQFRTHRDHARLCVAFRVAGRGELDLGLSILRFQQLQQAETDAA
jgi:hypothetical protein